MLTKIKKYCIENISFTKASLKTERFSSLLLIVGLLFCFGIIYTKIALVFIPLCLISFFLDREKTNKNIYFSFNIISIAGFLLFMLYLLTIV
jgi:hypothetical protein